MSVDPANLAGYGASLPRMYLERKIIHMAHSAHRPSHTAFLPDLSENLLQVPKRRPRFAWFLFAIAADALLALVVFAITNLILRSGAGHANRISSTSVRQTSLMSSSRIRLKNGNARERDA